MSVHFMCKSCGAEHRSPAGFVTRQLFDESPMPETQYLCHHTGGAMSYGKEDMYWRADVPLPNEPPPAPPAVVTLP